MLATTFTVCGVTAFADDAPQAITSDFTGIVEQDDGTKLLYVDGITSVQGLFKIDDDYYLADWGGVILTDGTYYAAATYCDLPAGRNYTIDADGKMLNGIVEIDGTRHYFINGITAPYGLHKINNAYYFVAWGGVIIAGLTYYVDTTFCDLPVGNYTFGTDGKMVNGIVEKDDILYLYINGVTAGNGLYKVGEDYYFSDWGGVIFTDGRYYVESTYCDLPAGKSYSFGADGKMLDGIVDVDGTLYLYINGDTTGNGLYKSGEDYYYSNWGGVVKTSGIFSVYNTYCDMPIGTYAFGADGKMLENLPTFYNITYELNGGENYYLNPTLYSADSIVTLQPATREDYVFDGWYTDDGVWEDRVESIELGSSGDITLYAKWLPAVEYTKPTSGTTAVFDNVFFAAPAVTVTTLDADYTLMYGTQEGEYNLATPPSFKEVGEHKVYFQIAADGYGTVSDYYIFEIEKYELKTALSYTSKNFTYPQAIEAPVLSGLPTWFEELGGKAEIIYMGWSNNQKFRAAGANFANLDNYPWYESIDWVTAYDHAKSFGIYALIDLGDAADYCYHKNGDNIETEYFHFASSMLISSTLAAQTMQNVELTFNNDFQDCIVAPTITTPDATYTLSYTVKFGNDTLYTGPGPYKVKYAGDYMVTCLVTPTGNTAVNYAPTPLSYRVRVLGMNISNHVELEIDEELEYPVTLSELNAHVVFDESVAAFTQQPDSKLFRWHDLDNNELTQADLVPGGQFKVVVIILYGPGANTNYYYTVDEVFTVKNRTMTGGKVASYQYVGSDENQEYNLMPDSVLNPQVIGPSADEISISYWCDDEDAYWTYKTITKPFLATKKYGKEFTINYTISAYGYDSIVGSYKIFTTDDRLFVTPPLYTAGYSEGVFYPMGDDGDYVWAEGLNINYSSGEYIDVYWLTKQNDPNNTETVNYYGYHPLNRLTERGLWHMVARVYKVVDGEQIQVYETDWDIHVGGITPTLKWKPRFNAPMSEVTGNGNWLPDRDEVTELISFYSQGEMQASDFEYLGWKIEVMCVDTDLYINKDYDNDPEWVGYRGSWCDVSIKARDGMMLDVSDDYFDIYQRCYLDSKRVRYKMRVTYSNSFSGIYETVSTPDLDFYVDYKGEIVFFDTPWLLQHDGPDGEVIPGIFNK
jgi:uncharacterized repeat protein (TIGR02543 family)